MACGGIYVTTSNEGKSLRPKSPVAEVKYTDTEDMISILRIIKALGRKAVSLIHRAFIYII